MPRIRTKRQRRRFIYLLMALELQKNISKLYWVHPLNDDRAERGEFYILYKDLHEYPDRFFDMYRMKPQQFDYLLNLVRTELTRRGCNYRQPLTAEERLVVTLT